MAWCDPDVGEMENCPTTTPESLIPKTLAPEKELVLGVVNSTALAEFVSQRPARVNGEGSDGDVQIAIPWSLMPAPIVWVAAMAPRLASKVIAPEVFHCAALTVPPT